MVAIRNKVEHIAEDKNITSNKPSPFLDDEVTSTQPCPGMISLSSVTARIVHQEVIPWNGQALLFLVMYSTLSVP